MSSIVQSVQYVASARPPRTIRWLRMLCTGLCAFSIAAPVISHAATYQSAWLQQSSDLQPDASVTFGTLPNGMRYAIRHNETPREATSMHLRIDAGSIQESAAQQGIAHLLEHMAFRGSRNIKDGEVVKTLERLGLQFGADTNASTSFSETIYRFDMPRSDQQSIDTGLKLLREISSELTISDAALKTERGVVLSELRLSDIPAQHAARARLSAMLPGQLLPDRFPIGKAEIIENADSKLVRSYYQKFYQPKRATLVVVGNIDVQQMEARIKAVFGSWQNTRAAGDDPDSGAPVKADTVFRSYAEASLPASISAAWVTPYDNTPPSIARKARETIEAIGIAVVNERFAKQALAQNAPFTGAGISSSDLDRSAHIASLGILTTPEKWQRALTATRAILNTTLQNGVTQEEVDRMVQESLARSKTASEQAATRTTSLLASNMIGSLGMNRVVISPEYIHQINSAAMTALKADTVTAALRKAFTSNSSLVFMSSSAPVENQQLADAYTNSNTAITDATQLALNNTQAWPYTNFGIAGNIASRTESPEQQATFVRFQNGVVVGVRPTKFADNEIQVIIKVDGGRLAQDKNAPVPAMLASFLTQGGLKQLDVLSLRKTLTGKTVSASAAVTDRFLILSGKTKPSDLELQLQYLTAFLVEPGFQSAAFEQMRSAFTAMLPQMQSQALTALGLRSSELLHNDPRWATLPTADQMQNFQLDTLRNWLEPMLKNGALQVSIVGDVNTETALKLASTTVGALSQRATPTVDIAPTGTLKFPAPTSQPMTFTHSGKADQTALAVAWPMPVWRGNKDEVPTLRVLGAIMQSRLLKALRDDSGQAYTANVATEGDRNIAEFGYLMAISVVKPEQLNSLRDTINRITTDLRRNPVSATELSEAVNPLAASMEKALQNNTALAQNLTSPEVDTLPYEQFNQGPERVRAVTAQRVQEAAAKYLLDAKQWQAVMQPQEQTNAAK